MPPIPASGAAIIDAVTVLPETPNEMPFELEKTTPGPVACVVPPEIDAMLGLVSGILRQLGHLDSSRCRGPNPIDLPIPDRGRYFVVAPGRQSNREVVCSGDCS